MNELKTIRLYGDLGRRFGRVHHLAVKNVAEAVRALSILHHGFEAYLMNAKDRGVEFAVRVGKSIVDKDGLLNPVGADDIRIAPIYKGSKRGVLQTVVGVFMVVIGYVITGLSFGLAAPLGSAMIKMGVGMIAGGIIQMLTPVPKTDARDRKDDRTSYVFNGPVNVQSQGASVPVLYGELIIGSVVISAGISTADNYVTGVPNTPGPGGPGSPGGGFNSGGAYNGNVVDQRDIQ